MTEYTVTIGFWLRAYDNFTVEAESDAEAIDKATAMAKKTMESGAQPDHIEIADRREGIIVFIDRIGAGRQDTVIEDVEFDDDRIHGPPAR
jgi:hypothetical protein